MFIKVLYYNFYLIDKKIKEKNIIIKFIKIKIHILF